MKETSPSKKATIPSLSACTRYVEDGDLDEVALFVLWVLAPVHGILFYFVSQLAIEWNPNIAAYYGNRSFAYLRVNFFPWTIDHRDAGLIQ
jgi:hypothetical protein